MPLLINNGSVVNYVYGSTFDMLHCLTGTGSSGVSGEMNNLVLVV